MFKNLRKAEGFTLIELIVVIAVLLLLMAIALPSFLGVRDKADEASLKSDLTVAYHNAKAEWAIDEAYGNEGALVTALSNAEPGLEFTSEEPTGEAIQVNVVSDDVIELSKVDKDGVEVTYTDATGVFAEK